MSSHTSLSDHCNSYQLFVCQSGVAEDLQTFITHTSMLHSFLWIWTLRPYYWANMFDVGDLPVPTFGNCVLKTGVIEWPRKLYIRFLHFFSKSQKTWHFTFLSCCTYFLQHWCEVLLLGLIPYLCCLCCSRDWYRICVVWVVVVRVNTVSVLSELLLLGLIPNLCCLCCCWG